MTRRSELFSLWYFFSSLSLLPIDFLIPLVIHGLLMLPVIFLRDFLWERVLLSARWVFQRNAQNSDFDLRDYNLEHCSSDIHTNVNINCRKTFHGHSYRFLLRLYFDRLWWRSSEEDLNVNQRHCRQASVKLLKLLLNYLVVLGHGKPKPCFQFPSRGLHWNCSF